jgi:hypothetical protein
VKILSIFEIVMHNKIEIFHKNILSQKMSELLCNDIVRMYRIFGIETDFLNIPLMKQKTKSKLNSYANEILTGDNEKIINIKNDIFWYILGIWFPVIDSMIHQEIIKFEDIPWKIDEKITEIIDRYISYTKHNL